MLTEKEEIIGSLGAGESDDSTNKNGGSRGGHEN